MAWEPGNPKTIQNQWFGSLEASKRYKNNGLGAWRFQNLTKTMVWEPGGPKTLQKQWFGSPLASRPPPPLCRGGGANPEAWIISVYNLNSRGQSTGVEAREDSVPGPPGAKKSKIHEIMV